MRRKKAFLNINSNLILQFIILAYGFVVPKIIISKFGSSVNGLISSITQFLAYISLLESGFGPVVKACLYKPIANKDKKNIAQILRTSERFFRKIAIIFIIYMILLCFLFPLIVDNTFDNFYTISLIIIISISTFSEYFFGMTYRLFLQADQKTYIISLIQILTYILSIVSVVILAKFNCSIHLIKLISGIIFVLRPIIQNIYVRKKYNINLKNIDGQYQIKQKWDGLIQHIAAVIHINTDITILTFFCPLTEISVYSVYYMVVKGIRSIIQSFSNGIDALFGDMIAKNEHNNLNSKFNIYELLYLNIITIIFTCTMILITPFISVYTKGITDVNYIRYTFGILLVVSEYIWAIRQPYSLVTLAAGHFKETRIGALVECITNIIISIVLVWKFGIVGVAIGTIIAMSIRTIEFVYHCNKYILNRNILYSIKKIIILFIETIIVILLSQNILSIDILNYIDWIKNAILVFGLSFSITIILNLVLYKKEMNQIFLIIKDCKILKKEKN